MHLKIYLISYTIWGRAILNPDKYFQVLLFTNPISNKSLILELQLFPTTHLFFVQDGVAKREKKSAKNSVEDKPLGKPTYYWTSVVINAVFF